MSPKFALNPIDECVIHLHRNAIMLFAQHNQYIVKHSSTTIHTKPQPIERLMPAIISASLHRSIAVQSIHANLSLLSSLSLSLSLPNSRPSRPISISLLEFNLKPNKIYIAFSNCIVYMAQQPHLQRQPNLCAIAFQVSAS